MGSAYQIFGKQVPAHVVSYFDWFADLHLPNTNKL